MGPGPQPPDKPSPAPSLCPEGMEPELRATWSLFSGQNTAAESSLPGNQDPCKRTQCSGHNGQGEANTGGEERSPLSMGCPAPTGTSNLCMGASSVPASVPSKLRKLSHLSLSTTHNSRKKSFTPFQRGENRGTGTLRGLSQNSARAGR